jgi:Ca2+-binding RTX toxin-like protein
VDSGSGDDAVQVSGAGLPADSLIRVDGGQGEDTLLFDPAGQAIDPPLPLPGAGSVKVAGPDFGPVHYERVEQIPGFQAAEANAGGTVTIHEGESLTLVGTATAATNTKIVSLVWEINGNRVELKGEGLLYDEVPDLYSATTSFSWEALKGFGLNDDGRYTLYLRALDDQGRIVEDEGTVSIVETAPVIALTGDSSPEVGEDYEVLFSALDPGDDRVSRWTIHWGDGVVETLGSDAARASHAYATTGDYAASLSAQDEDGTYTAGTSVGVRPAIPQTRGPYTILEGQGLQLHATAAGTPELAWDLDGDGEFDDAFGKDPVISWSQLQSLDIPIADSGTYGVKARATYMDYGSGVTQSSVGSGRLTVLNAPPSAAFGNSGPVNEGDAVTVSFADATDPSSADQAWGFKYSFDTDNDGVFDILESASRSAGLKAVDAGSWIVRGRITDKDGGHRDYLTSIAVREVAPTLQVTGPDSVDEGAVYSLVLGAVDPGSDTVSQWVVNWGDGSPNQVIKAQAASLTHVFADDGAFDVSIVAIDEDGIYEATKPVVVRNVAPTLVMAGLPSLVEGGEYTLFLGVEDPGADTLSEWTIDWGDGSVETLAGEARSRAHVYQDDSAGEPGAAYRIRVTVVDEDSPSGSSYTVPRVASLARPVFHFIEETGSTGHFYQLTSHESSWAEAQAEADNLGGYLASVLSMEEQAFLESAFLEGDRAAGRLWIGLTDALDEGVFQWTTGESLDYMNWAVGQPDDAGGGQDYGVLVRQTDSGMSVLGFGSLAEGGSDYVEQGFRLSTTGSFAAANGLSGPGLRAGTQGETFTVEDADGGVFALQSLQISSALDRSMVFVGTRPDGSTITRTFEIAGSAAPVFQKVIFGQEFATLTSVSWSAGDTVVDDIQVSRPLSLWADESGSEAFLGVIELNSITGLPASAGNELLVTVRNEAPVAFLSGPGQVDEGAVFTLRIAPPEDPGADTVTAYVIDWGDGSALQRVAPPGANPNGLLGSLLVSHVYEDGDADYSISLQIEDEDGLHDGSEAFAAHVRNVAPTLNISGASHVLEGLPYELSLGPLCDPGDDTLTGCTVDWGDGNLEDFAGLGIVTHTYYGAGTREISVRLTDEDGAYSHAAAMTVAVADAPPTVALSGASWVDEGSLYTLTLGEARDPGAPGDTLNLDQYIVHWGDGTSDTYTEPGDVTHLYLDGDFEHTILVDLEVGGSVYLNASSLPVTVRNVGPAISLTGASMADEGSMYLLSLGEVIDPGADTVTEYVVDWGDETVESFSNPGQLGHTYLEGHAAPVIVVTLVDEDGRHDGGRQSIEIKNVAPVITTLSVSKPAVTPNEEVMLTGAFTDRGILDTHAATIDWGDGTITSAVITESGGSGSFLAGHVYGRGGTFDIQVTLKDDDGAAASDSERVIVTGADLKDGVLYIAGTAGDDRVSINKACGSIMVHANFLSGPNHVRTFKAADVKRIEMYLGDGNDHAQIAGNIDLPVTMDGGAGNDHLNAGRGPAVLIGGDGNDKLIGSRGNDKVYGGTGNDLILGGGGNDFLDGGSGNDRILGSCGNDVILGGDGNDRLFGGWGDDQLLGGDGNDLLVGGPGKDTLGGGSGKDKLIDWSCKTAKSQSCHDVKTPTCSSWVKSFVTDQCEDLGKNRPNEQIKIVLPAVETGRQGIGDKGGRR